MGAYVAVFLVLATLLTGCVPGEDLGPRSAPLPDEAMAVSESGPAVAAKPADHQAPSRPPMERGRAEPAIPAVGTPDAPLAIPAPEGAAEAHPDAPVYDRSAEESYKVASFITGPDGKTQPATRLSAKVTPVEGEKRFTVEGAFQLKGDISLTDPEAGKWVLEGSVTFPNDGYKTGQVFLSSAQTMMPPKEPGG